MKIFGIELIPWQVAFLQQWGILPGGKSAGEKVHDRTTIEGVHGPELVHFDGSEQVNSTVHWQHPSSSNGFVNGPLIPQEVWDAALNPEPTHQVPPAFDAKQSKPLTYPMEFPDDFFTSRETPSLTPPVDEATTQRALDYIKAGQGQPYVWPGYDDVYHEDAHGLFQFQPGTFGPILPRKSMTVTDLPVDIQEANAANLRKRNRNQRKALRQLNKAMVGKLYELQQSRNAEAYYVVHAENLNNRINLDAELHERQVKELQTTIDRLNRTMERRDVSVVTLNHQWNLERTKIVELRRDWDDDVAIRDSIISRLEAKVSKLKGRNKNLRRKLRGSGGE